VVQAGKSTLKILGFAGYSGSGKTTLLEKVIPLLTAQGLCVSVIKHAHHNFDIDRPGKDSFRHREAGAHEILIASSHRWALMHELREEAEPTLEDLCGKLSACDLALVEGFKFSGIPKIEVHRVETQHPLLHPNDSNIVAIATDSEAEFKIPKLDLDAPLLVADYILGFYRTGQK
jgi:molybdopterin-guanine dinucleotide biosynthesis protein B